ALRSSTICNGGSATASAALTGKGPWTVTWFDGTTSTVHAGVGGTGYTGTDSLPVSPSSTTTYTVTALNDANCTAQSGDLTGSALVTVNPRPTAAASGSTTICNGSSATVSAALTGKEPWNVTWYAGTTTPLHTGVAAFPTRRSSDLPVSPSSTTTYSVTALTDTRCTAQSGDLTGSALVTVNPRPTAAVSGSTTICNGGSATVSAALTGKGPWNVTWYDGATTTLHTSVDGTVSTGPDTLTISPPSTKTYTVTALSDARCTAQPGDLTGSAVVTVDTLTVTPNPSSQSVQYSDPISAVTITATDTVSAGSSLTATTQWKVGTGSFVSGLPSWLSWTPGTPAANSETWTLAGTALTAPGT